MRWEIVSPTKVDIPSLASSLTFNSMLLVDRLLQGAATVCNELWRCCHASLIKGVVWRHTAAAATAAASEVRICTSLCKRLPQKWNVIMKWKRSDLKYAFENWLGAGLVSHTMQTNPAAEQSKIVRWSEGLWNQSGLELLRFNRH